MANVHNVGEGGTIQDFFRSIPMVTKILVCGTLLATLVTQFGLCSPYTMTFNAERTWNNFEVQRLIFPYFYAGGFSFNFAIHLYSLYDFCNRYEANPFNTGAGGSSADFLWMILLGMVICNIVNYLCLELPVLSEPLLYMIIYVWSRREADMPQKFMGLGPFKAMYLPWIYMAIRMLMGGSISGMILGVVVGHAYYFFYEMVPEMYPQVNLRGFGTPYFCRYAQERFTGMSAPANAPAPRAAAGGAGVQGVPPPQQRAAAAAGGNFGGGYNWGGPARRLGTQ